MQYIPIHLLLQVLDDKRHFIVGQVQSCHYAAGGSELTLAAPLLHAA